MPPLVLLVEDDATLRLLGQKQLERLGVTADIVPSGALAVEQAKEKAYDLILMDLSMAGLNGLEATLIIRREESETGRARTPIIAMTAYERDEDIFRAGMDDYLQKPVMLPQLRELLRKWIPEFSTNSV